MELSNKLYKTSVSFTEVPDRTTLCLWFSGCGGPCEGCHTPHLHKNVGRTVTTKDILDIVDDYVPYVDCVCFMGGEPWDVFSSLLTLLYLPGSFRTAYYTHYDLQTIMKVDPQDGWGYVLHYLKVGKYDPERGGLDNPNTNQRFYYSYDDKWVDGTNKFQQKQITS